MALKEFQEAEAALEKARTLLQEKASDLGFRQAYEQLLQECDDLLDMSRWFVKFSDAAEQQLLEANDRIQAQQNELKNTHEELQQHANTLEEEVNARTWELKETHKKLQEAYLTIEDANASLRTRLSARKWAVRLGVGLIVMLLAVFVVHRYDVIEQLQSLVVQVAEYWQGEGESPAMATKSSKTMTLAEVEQRPVSYWLRLKGNIRPLEWIDIGSPIDAVVTEVHFKYGQPVDKGQLLLKLDTSELNVQLRDVTSNYIKVVEEVEKLNDWANSLEAVRARREVSKAEDALNLSRRKVAETQKLFKKGIIARSELENAESTVKERQLGLISARENLGKTLDEGNELKLRMARLTLENAKQKLNDAEQAIKNAEIYSPAGGIVLPVQNINALGKTQAAAEINIGTPVSRNSPMLKVANLQGIALDAQVDEKQLLKLKTGLPVEVQINAIQGLVLDGRIDFIAGQAMPATGRSGQSGGTSFKVVIQVNDLPAEHKANIRIGMSATARIRTYDNPSALVIPFEAVTIKGSQRLVRLVGEDGQIEQRRIEIRSTLADGIEVASGLQAGDKLLLDN